MENWDIIPLAYPAKNLKRKRDSMTDSTEIDLVTVTNIMGYREELCAKNLLQFESIVQQRQANKKLSKVEAEFFKRIRRKISNRESARISRTNKRNQIDQIEETILMMQHENAKIFDECIALKTQNICIKSDIEFMMELINGNESLRAVFAEQDLEFNLSTDQFFK